MNRSELEAHIQELFDGNITDEQLKHLQEQLRTNPEAKEIYRDFAHIQSGLEQKSTTNFPPQQVVPIDLILRRQRIAAQALHHGH